MKRIIIFGALVLAGCDEVSWDHAAARHTCTQPQMAKAEQETLFCKKEGGYMGAYCYQTAIQRNCTPRK